MNDADVDEMRNQIRKEADLDPMDGGVPSDGGDGVSRYPTDASGMAVDPEMDVGDRAKMAMGIPLEGEEGEEEEEPVEDEKDFHVKKKGNK